MRETNYISIPLATLVQHLDACFEQLGQKQVFLNRRDWELIKANLRSAESDTERLKDYLVQHTLREPVNDQLKPCPYCGSVDISLVGYQDGTRPTGKYFESRCEHCGATSVGSAFEDIAASEWNKFSEAVVREV